jgi:hypothetical protein
MILFSLCPKLITTHRARRKAITNAKKTGEHNIFALQDCAHADRLVSFHYKEVILHHETLLSNSSLVI